jgi:hypothetical protein
VNRYQRCPLLLVQGNIENNRIGIFYAFTHLITDGNACCLPVCFFSIPTTNLDDTNLVMVNICS